MTIVCNELLGRELIKIYQDPDSFSFSIDSMLLADFVTINTKVKRICDLCSGNAPIPLYLSLRTKANIVGVEVQKSSYELANMSINENKLDSQIEMKLANLKGVHKEIGKFDVVTCNPPFFKLGDNQINPNDKKAIARHEVLASLDDIIKEASTLLNSKGRLAMVHRPDRLVEILEVLRNIKSSQKDYNLYIQNKIRNVIIY